MLYPYAYFNIAGYAEIVLKSMAKLKAQMGQDTVGCVLPDNNRSHNLFKKLNFQVIQDTFWIKPEE